MQKQLIDKESVIDIDNNKTDKNFVNWKYDLLTL